MESDAMDKSGRLIVICGCMFAGKTTRLIERLEAARSAGRRVLALKNALDRRYDETQLITHDRRGFEARTVSRAEEIVDRAAEGARPDVIGVDEVHFFGHEIVDVLARLVAEGATVIVAGIDHDAWGQEFPHVAELKRRAAEVELRTVPCTVCGRPARYSQRMVPVTEPTMVGGPAEYQPRCRDCFEPLPGPAPRYDA